MVAVSNRPPGAYPQRWDGLGEGAPCSYSLPHKLRNALIENELKGWVRLMAVWIKIEHLCYNYIKIQ